MKKIMVLGGSENQLPLIKTAKNMGHYIIVCDYSEENVGKDYANMFYCISTLDKKAVLETARLEKIDSIVTNSEPAVPIAAYVANEMDIPSTSYESILTLTRKDLLRKFLIKRKFNSPKAFSTSIYYEALDSLKDLTFPVMVKPIDSSGSRGVSRINSPSDLKEVFDKALHFSKKGDVLIEEYIERIHDSMIGGDIFIFNGEVIFWGLMDSMRDKNVSEFVPVGTSFPSFLSAEQFDKIKQTINKMIKELNIIFGSFNLEMMFNEKNELYIIEMNPRSGGNNIPELLNMATGFNVYEAYIKASLGYQELDIKLKKEKKYISTYVLHSKINGILKSILYNDEIMNNVTEVKLTKQIGDAVEKFDSADKLIGVVFLKFDSQDEMAEKLKNINTLISVDVI